MSRLVKKEILCLVLKEASENPQVLVALTPGAIDPSRGGTVSRANGITGGTLLRAPECRIGAETHTWRAPFENFYASKE